LLQQHGIGGVSISHGCFTISLAWLEVGGFTPMRIIPLFISVLLIATGCGHGAPPVAALSDSEVDGVIAALSPTNSYHDNIQRKDRTGYEATKWISTNRNFAPFGSNHFPSREAAVKYVRDLYRLGATAVYVTDVLEEPDRIKTEGGPYSDSMYVYLPSTGPRRKAIFALEAKEAKAQGFVGSDDTGQTWLLFWMHE
jgi:hypothetical protein